MYYAPSPFTNGQLYNCCTKGLEPDWSQYTQLEIRPVIDHADKDGQTHCEAISLDQSDLADFWSVYARQPSGEVDAITDSRSETTIHQIGQYLSTRSGLPLC